ncbi:MAG: DNA repair protein RecO [Candidatus Omnitrophota bacterium]
MTIHKTNAIVLNRKDYRETSFLLSFYTSDFGKIYAQAKGARRKADKFGTNFLPITYNKIVFYENKRSDLHIISQADLIEPFINIDKDIERYTYATYFLELVSSGMPGGEKNTQVFNLVMKFLNLLNNEDKINNITQIFEVIFLNLSGFKPRLDSCVNCNNEILDKSKFSSAAGGLLCDKCFYADSNAKSLMPGTIATIKYIETIELDKIASFKMVRSVGNELSIILRTFIDFHIGEKFKALDFLQKVRGLYV